QIHLAVVIAVRQLNLLQYRQALGGERRRQKNEYDEERSAQASSQNGNQTYYPKTSSSLAAKFNSEQAAMLTRLASKTGACRPCTKIGMSNRFPPSEMAPLAAWKQMSRRTQPPIAAWVRSAQVKRSCHKKLCSSALSTANAVAGR